MAEEYKTSSTSRTSADVEERELSRSKTTRKVLRASLHHNPTTPAAAVSIEIVHQRKRPKEAWEDLKSQPLTRLKAGDAVKLALTSEETLALSRELPQLYALYDEKGVQYGEKRLVVADPSEIIRVDEERASLIRELVDKGHGDEFWTLLVEEDAELATRLSNAKIHQDRLRALDRFRALLEDDAAEPVWQEFLDQNTWIFGYGLDYRILEVVQRQPDYGGRRVSGRGSQKGDNLTATVGDLRFTVLVEIKKPSTPLLGSKYRNAAYRASPELAGGIAQVQKNCHTWEVDGSRKDENRDDLGDTLTVRPKGILVIGRGEDLNSREKRVCFELLRRNTFNPEIITFDELFARAEFIVRGEDAPSITAPSDSRKSTDNGA